jgi:hypothetical protein
MKKRHYGVMIVLSLMVGLAGTIITNQVFVAAPASAEKIAARKKVIVAEEFRLVDKEGKVVSTWGMYAGGPGMVLFNKQGKFRAVFSLTSPEESPVLTFADKDGVHRAIIGMKAERRPYITLRDEAGRERISISLDDAGDPYMVLYDNEENERAVFGTVDLTKIKRTGSIKTSSIASFVLFGKDGQVTWRAP